MLQPRLWEEPRKIPRMRDPKGATACREASGVNMDPEGP